MEPPGQIATLILPADTAWSEADRPAPSLARPPIAEADAKAVDQAADVLRTGKKAAILIRGSALKEQYRVGAGWSSQSRLRARSLFDLHDPTLDWVKLAEGMGVEAARAETTERFADLFSSAMKTRGPRLIEAVI